jgi:hypothetical protein
MLSRLMEWRDLLIVVKPDTLIRWHRNGFRLFWRWKSRLLGRPRLPADLQRLIGDMATANRTWGEERIASEILLKLGIRVSPRTVRCYMPTGDSRPAIECCATINRHRLPFGHRADATPILGGLHHEYRLEVAAA